MYGNGRDELGCLADGDQQPEKVVRDFVIVPSWNPCTETRPEADVNSWPNSKSSIPILKLHPLSKELMDSLEEVEACVIPLVGGPEEFRAVAGEADAILNADFSLTADLIAALRRCRVISRFGTGVENIDVPFAAAQGIPVTNVPEFCTQEVANRVLTLLLACACRLIQLDRSLRDGEWRLPRVPDTVQIEGQTLGLLGFGKIARAVARRACALGMKLMAYDPYVSPSEIESQGASSCSFDSLLTISDIISIHAPLTPATRHLVDMRALSLIKPTAILINCSRGGSLTRRH